MFYVARATHRGGFPAGTHLGWAPRAQYTCGRLHGGAPCPNPAWASGPSPISARGTHLPPAPPAGHLAFPSCIWSLSGPGSATSPSLPCPPPGPPRPPPPGPAESRREGPRRQPFPAGLSPARKYDSCIIFSPLEARRLHSREEKTRTLSSIPGSSHTPSCSRPRPFLSCSPPPRLPALTLAVPRPPCPRLKCQRLRAPFLTACPGPPPPVPFLGPCTSCWHHRLAFQTCLWAHWSSALDRGFLRAGSGWSWPRARPGPWCCPAPEMSARYAPELAAGSGLAGCHEQRPL